ncbi:hypothetical protein KAS14_07135 [Candidatus Bathyarchaeota archaeon]|nr:hypothetical protein [Candidatus Bathyarchaeota archaeon]
MLRKRKSLTLFIVLIICIPGGIFATFYFSATSANFYVSLITPTTDLISALLSGKIEFDIFLNVTGNGPISITSKGFNFSVYMEDVYVGNIKNTEGFSILAGSTEFIHTILTIDISTLSIEDIENIINLFYEQEGELFIKLEGWIDVIILFFTIRLPYTKIMPFANS